MNQERGKHSKHEEVHDASEEQARKLGAEVAKKAELDDATDDILDEIDNVLEENAEEFVKSYIQKGGQ